MRRWLITIEAWPHSTGNGQTADQAAAGDRVQSYCVNARDIAEALYLANCIVKGMKSNPMVWEAPITGITQQKETDQ